MSDNLNVHAFSSVPVYNKFVTNKSPDIFNLQFAPHNRIFIFEQSEGSIFIDFIEHRIEANCLYIIPRQHYHHLDLHCTGSFIYMELNDLCLNEYHKELLYAIKYSRYKMLPPNGPADYGTYANISTLAAHNHSDQHIMSVIGKCIEDRTLFCGGVANKKGNCNYTGIASRFLNLLATRKLTLECCKVSALAHEIFCSERTLHRACIAVFGICAREIANYHLRLRAIALLTNPLLSFNDIAIELEFSGVTSFNHFIKKVTCFTPSHIRTVFRNNTFMALANAC